ncbi:hypothetical protein J6590_015337 [Homalodisca vitripennis]|nr:hypothetical protein J6590_015337 [Homalodisca vitripennis]
MLITLYTIPMKIFTLVTPYLESESPIWCDKTHTSVVANLYLIYPYASHFTFLLVQHLESDAVTNLTPGVMFLWKDKKVVNEESHLYQKLNSSM